MRGFYITLMMVVVATAVTACAVQQAPARIESNAPATDTAKPFVSATAEPTATAKPAPLTLSPTAESALTNTLEPVVATKTSALPTATLTPALPKTTSIPVLPTPTQLSTATAKHAPEARETATPEPYRAPVATYSPEDSTSHGDGSSRPEYGNRQMDCVSDPSPVLTSHIADLSTIGSIQPPSVISGNWYKNRSYLNIAAEHGALAPSVTVYAPADATLTGITYYLQPMNDIDGNLLDVPQFELRLQISCEVTYGFDHLTELGPGIAELAPAEPSTSTRDAEKSVSFEVKAGDVLGYTTGTIVANSWDFIFSNTAVVNSFANQERYENTGD